jgi:hypothetical protein
VTGPESGLLPPRRECYRLVAIVTPLRDTLPLMCSPRKWLFVLFVALIAARYGDTQSSAAGNAVRSYPDTSAGLEHLKTDMLALQRSGDNKTLAPYLNSLVLPNSDSWFTAKFGNVRCSERQLDPNDCLGPRMEFAYRSLARVLPASFSLTLTDLLSEGLTNFEATNYTGDCPGPDRIVAARELVGGLTTTPHLSSVLSRLVQHREPIYVLWAYNEHKETTLPFFVYFEGAFRYIGMLHPSPIEDLQKTTAEDTDPPAHYLTENQLEMKKVIIDPSLVQRTVVLRVSISSEGKPKEVGYVRGPEVEKESAIQSVMKRHFDRPGFGPGGIHPNLFCLNIVASR